MKSRLLLLPLLNILFLIPAQGQEIHFSQFFAAPLFVNPALTGNAECMVSIGGNFKQQWQSSTANYQTYSFYADGRIGPKALKADYFGVGAIFYSDKAGYGDLSNTNASLCLSYTKSFDRRRKYITSLGVRISYVNRHIGTGALSWDDQWDGTSFSSGMPTSEPISGSASYFDMGAGLFGSFNLSDNFNFHLGATMEHIIRPDEKFSGGPNRLGWKNVIHGGFNVITSKKLMIMPKVMVSMQNGTNEAIAGLNFITRSGNSNIYLGAWYRFGRDIIPVIGFEYKKFVLLFNYDLNVSRFSRATKGAGGFEFSLSKSFPCVIKHPNIPEMPKHSKNKFNRCPTF